MSNFPSISVLFVLLVRMLFSYIRVTPNIWASFQPTMQKLLPREYGRARMQLALA
jgi:hypothetical protein